MKNPFQLVPALRELTAPLPEEVVYMIFSSQPIFFLFITALFFRARGGAGYCLLGMVAVIILRYILVEELVISLSDQTILLAYFLFIEPSIRDHKMLSVMFYIAITLFAVIVPLVYFIDAS